MTRRATAILLAVLLGTAVTALQTSEQPPQTFRIRTDLVHVDVSVRENGRAVTGLRAEDFVLTDNGDRQRLDSVEATAVPIDLTLVVDFSGSPRGLWVPKESPAAAIAKLEADVRDIAGVLRADDRVRLIAIDTRVQQLLPMQPVTELKKPQPATTGGKGAVYDTLAAALLYPVEPRRRHVVIAATKGMDTISSVSAQSVKAIAERSDALFHLVAMESETDNDDEFSRFQCGMMGYCWPTRQFWVPFRNRLFGPAPFHVLTPDGDAVRSGAEATGGGLHKAEMLNVPNLKSTFKKAFEDFRSSYVLRYTPEGRAKAGWHAIQVRVPRLRSATVRSRTGYLVEDSTPAPPAPVPEVPRTLQQFTAAYERGAFRELVVGLEQHTEPGALLRELEGSGNPWPAAPRREAAFALELADNAIFSAKPQEREATHRLLVRFSRLIRHPLDPDIFERYWYFAVLTLLEGTLRPELADAMLNAAIERFPDEPRFILSRAIVSEQKWMMRNQPQSAGSAARSVTIDTVRKHFEAATAHPGTATEAHLRYAWVLYGIDQNKEALEHLQQVAAAGRTAESGLRYLHQLFLGHVLKELGRNDDAMAAYRAALEIMPSAQSARVALMNGLLLRGAREQAEQLAEQIQAAEPPQNLDPWWLYVQGQYRMHRQALARVREMSR